MGSCACSWTGLKHSCPVPAAAHLAPSASEEVPSGMKVDGVLGSILCSPFPRESQSPNLAPGEDSQGWDILPMELLQSGLCPGGNNSNQLSAWRNRLGEKSWWGCALHGKKSGTIWLQGKFTEWVPGKTHREMGYQQQGTCALPPCWAGRAVGRCLCCCSHGSLAAISVGQLHPPE